MKANYERLGKIKQDLYEDAIKTFREAMAENVLTLPPVAYTGRSWMDDYSVDRYGAMTYPNYNYETYPNYNYEPRITAGASLDDILRYLQLSNQKGGLDAQGVQRVAEAFYGVIATLQGKIEELEGALFDHIDDGSDLDGPDN